MTWFGWWSEAGRGALVGCDLVAVLEKDDEVVVVVGVVMDFPAFRCRELSCARNAPCDHWAVGATALLNCAGWDKAVGAAVVDTSRVCRPRRCRKAKFEAADGEVVMMKSRRSSRENFAKAAAFVAAQN